VILSADTTVVMGVNPPCNAAGAVTIDEADSRWTTWMANLAKRSATNGATTNQSAALSTGITLTCTGPQTSGLSGTYIVSADFMTFLMAAQAGGFPASFLTTLVVNDSQNTLHTFKNAAAFNTFYQIVAGYWIAINQYYQTIAAGGTASLPANTSGAC
jgi:hypothetical protein